MALTRKRAKEIVIESINDEIENFLPNNGTPYVNGSIPRGPYYNDEKARVKRAAFEEARRRAEREQNG